MHFQCQIVHKTRNMSQNNAKESVSRNGKTPKKTKTPQAATKKKQNGKVKRKPPEIMAHIEHLLNVAKVAAEAGNPLLANNYGSILKSLGRKCVIRL